MSPEKEAALAAEQAKGRAKGIYEVVGRALVVNDRVRKVGGRIRMSHADGEILVASGRLKPAKGKASAEAAEDVGQ